MKIFLTGGTGFVGSRFIEQAQAAGHALVAQRRPGASARRPLERQPRWVDRALDGDFRDELAGCEALVHFAAHTPNPPYAPLDECLYWNVVASTRLLQQAAAAGIRNIVVAGSCFEYGAAADGQEFVHPATESRPSLSYPVSKAAATTSFLGLARQLGLRLQVLRIFQVYGEGEAATRFWPSLRAAALAGKDFSMSAGLQVRDFIGVDEVARQFLRTVEENAAQPGRPRLRNVGTGKGQSLLEFARHWWQEWGATGSLRPGELGLRAGESTRLVANVSDIHVA
ncbi:MAG: NAD(P)-dependent oxidoreductase [Burkholderiales bacterium]|nr:NAD(P)-dependent oxidoreductase [Burkholderiales bacterium]